MSSSGYVRISDAEIPTAVLNGSTTAPFTLIDIDDRKNADGTV